MTEPVKRAGQYTLDTFRISRFNSGRSIDIKNLIHTWELTESMSSGHLYGQATIYDSVGLLDKFNDGTFMRGEEEVLIEYRDWFDEFPRSHRMFVYAITDVNTVRESDGGMYSYQLYFVSKDKFLTENFMVRRAFKNSLISDNVQTIFDEYYTDTDKEIFIEETEGLQDLLVPNYSPEQTMNFFARKAYSGQNPSQTWRFFENRDRYVFATHEELVFDNQGNEIPLFVRINGADQTAEGQRLLMQSIIELKYPLYINTLKDMVDGAYYSRTTELDILNRSVVYNDYNYLNEASNYLFPDPGGVRSKHSRAFINQYMNYPRDRLVVKDYRDPSNPDGPEVRPDTFYSQMYNDKRINHYHYNTEKLELKIYGSNDIVAGKILQLDLREVNNAHETREEDEKRSGNYLIESIRNVFHEETYFQVLTISKSGFKGRQE